MYKIPANTLFLGKNLVFVPECHSTNTIALQFTQKPSATEGTVVITDHQTAGRGQRGNFWEAEPGMNLTFSIIFKPFFLPAREQHFLTIMTSLAVRDYLLSRIAEPVSIKWPNDILIDNKKVCGILIENQVQGPQIMSTVAGIGLNVNQTEFGIDKTTSLKLLTQTVTPLNEALETLLSCIEGRYLQLRQQKYDGLMKEYLDCLYWRNEKHIFSSGNMNFEGTIESIGEDGGLLIRTDEGIRSFQVKELVFFS